MLATKSTTSLQKYTPPKMQPNASKSTESVYSSSSSKYSASAIYRRSHTNGNAGVGLVGGTAAGRSNEVRQRVLSARRLRLKTLQNQLTDAQMHIAELAQENRILRTLHKRQDNALSKYENTNAELPQLLHSHSEEVRVWQAKYRNLQSQNKELAGRLKQKEATILGLSDQNKHFMQLNNDRNLEERERLTERVRYLEQRLIDKDNDMKLLARRLQLDKKTFKNQIQTEHNRYKELMTRLEKTRSELGGFTSLDQLDIADKLAKASLLPKSIQGGTKVKNIVKTDKSPRMIQNGLDLQANIPQTIRLRNRSLSPKSDKDIELSTPSPITMRRKSSLDKNTVNFEEISHLQKGNQRSSQLDNNLTQAFEMNSLKKNDYDELSLNGSERYLNEYSKLNKNHDAKDESYKRQAYQNDSYKDTFEEDFGDEDINEDNADECESADLISSDLPLKTKNDFANIRKQITDEYQQRETFLDTFCRESSSEALLDDFKRSNIDPKQKTKLLAALKAIDENKSKDSA